MSKQRTECGTSNRNEKWVVRWLLLSVPVLGIISFLNGLNLTLLVPTVKRHSIPQILVWGSLKNLR